MELAQPAGGLSSARILVDNEATNVRTLSRILRAAGYTNVSRCWCSPATRRSRRAAARFRRAPRTS